MRRSRRIATLTLGGACLLALAACGDDDGAEAKVYPSVEDCVAETKDEATCKKDFEDAQKRHAETAPNYPARGSCEEMYGQGKCVPVQKQDSHGGLTEMFMPALAGFLLGRTMGQSQPVVVDRSGYAYVGGNRWGTPPRRDERSYGGGGGGYYGGGSSSGKTGTYTLRKSGGSVPDAGGVSRSGSSGGGSVSRGGFGSSAGSFSSAS